MARRRGLQAEILASLGLVVLTATGVLVAALAHTQAASVEPLRQLSVDALLADARRPLPMTSARVAGLRWWRVEEGRAAVPHGLPGEPIDTETLRLATEAERRGHPLLRAGRFWEPVRLAVPGPDGVRVARLAPSAPKGLLLGLLLADVAIFTAFGATLLRGRLVRPLQRLEHAARAIAAGDLAVRAPVEGPRETSELAGAFNAMTEALAARGQALEKAVADLRTSNRSLREARAGLDRAERLAAVGRLAAGVAHEVGNPMGAVLAFVDLARRDAGLAEASRGHLGRALQEGERVRVILRRLLDFSRPPRAERVPLDLVAVCEETAGLVRAQPRYGDVEVEVAAEGGPPPGLADRNAVAQIVLNLLINAADALEGCPQPHIRVTVRPALGARRAGDEDHPLPPRSHPDAVEVRVSDTGPGIPDEDQERIFDPFFSTKAPGQGTGLGLSNALRFAEELGGSLELEPSDRGAVFVLRLPSAAAPDVTPRRVS